MIVTRRVWMPRPWLAAAQPLCDQEGMSGTGVRALSALLLALAACCLARASAVNYSLPQRLPGDCLSAGVTLPAGGLFPAQLIGGTTPMPGSATVQVRQARLAAIVVVVACPLRWDGPNLRMGDTAAC